MDLRINQQPPVQPLPPRNQPQPTPPQDQPADQVQIRFFWQDPFVGPADTGLVDRSVVGGDLSNARVRSDDNRELIRPDENGNYLTTPGSDGESQVNAQVTTTRTLNMWESYRRGGINWSFWGGGPLDVVAHKKEGMNAYYSRWEGSTNYFFQASPHLNTVVKTANSSDVVSHEAGHAILDGMKPGYLSTSDRETGAFHEAFGDCSAILMCLQDVALNERILAQTGGDLSKPNAIAWLAEEFGKARRLGNDDPDDDDRAWLRNSQNAFTYVKPETLGDGRGDDYTLGGEIHSFARLFAGAFYDCLQAAYLHGLNQENLPPAQALKFAADTMGPLLARAVDRAPANRGRYKDMGLGMINADAETNGGKLGEAFKKVFLDRKIITPADLSQEQVRRANLPDLRVDHDFTSAEEATAYVAARAQQLGLPADAPWSNAVVSRNAQGEQVVNLLYTREVPVTLAGYEGLKTDVTGGVTLAFDAQGRLADFRHNSVSDEAVQEEMEGLAYMQRKGQILEDSRGPMIYTRDDGKPYLAVIRGDKLVRVPSSACDCGGH